MKHKWLLLLLSLFLLACVPTPEQEFIVNKGEEKDWNFVLQKAADQREELELSDTKRKKEAWRGRKQARHSQRRT